MLCNCWDCNSVADELVPISPTDVCILLNQFKSDCMKWEENQDDDDDDADDDDA